MRRIGIAVLLLAILLGAVVFSPQGEESSLWIRTLHNFAHGPIFGGVALVTLYVLRAHPRFASRALLHQYALVFVLAAVLGLATEIAQRYTGRDASWADLFTDVVGIVSCLLVFGAFDPARRASPRARWVFALSGSVALVLLASPPILAAHAYLQRATGFPVIVDFTEGVGGQFITLRNARAEIVAVPEEWRASKGERALHVRLTGADWPGVQISEPSPDWTGYRELAIELFNPQSAALRMSIRIDDRHHNNRFEDRYNASFELPSLERTTIRIPLEDIESAPRGRPFDLRNVAAIVIFRREALSGETIYLVRAQLE